MQKFYDILWWRGSCMCSAQEPQNVEGGCLGSNPHQMEVSPLLVTVEGGKMSHFAFILQADQQFLKS